MRAAIEKTTQEILLARAKHPALSLAKLYTDNRMPEDLRAAHQANDKAVLKAYGFPKGITKPEITAELMRRYQKLAEK